MHRDRAKGGPFAGKLHSGDLVSIEPRRVPNLRRLLLGALALGVVLLFTFPLAAAPDEAPGPNPPADRTCDDVLSKAIQAQNPTDIRMEIRAFEARYQVISYADGNRIETLVHQEYSKSSEGDGGETYRCEIEERGLGKKTVQTYDGKNYTFEDKNGRIVLKGKSYERDREAIRSDLRNLKYLLDFVFLDHLRGEGVSFEAVESGEGRPFHRLRRSAPGERPMLLRIDATDFSLAGVDLLPWPEDDRTVRFTFEDRCQNVHVGGKKRKDFWVPKTIKIHMEEGEALRDVPSGKEPETRTTVNLFRLE